MEEKIIEAVEMNETKNADTNNGTEKADNTYHVELVDSQNNEKQPGGVLAIISFVFALVSLGLALLNVIFAPLTIVSTLILEIMPFIHALFCLPVIILSILAIVFANIAKKKGNKTKKVKLGSVLGIISTVVLGLSIILMTVFGVIAVVLAIILGVTAALAGAAVSSLIGALATLSPALAPLLAIVAAIAPVLVESFADVAAAEIIPMIIEYIASLLSGIIVLPIL